MKPYAEQGTTAQDLNRALIEYDGDNSKPYCDLVYKALKEMKQREQGCEWCALESMRNISGRIFYKELTHDTSFLTSLDDASLQIAYDKQSGWVLHYEDENGDRMFDVKITHCSNCGRDLRKDANI